MAAHSNSLLPFTHRAIGRAKLNSKGYHAHVFAVVGFVFGFLTALGTLLLHFENLKDVSERSQWQEYYTRAASSLWRRSMVVSEPIDSQNTELVSLHNEVRVLCMVLTCPKYHEVRARHIKATWGRRCNKLIFVSSLADEELGAIAAVSEESDQYGNLWNKTGEGFRHAYEEHFNEYDWFLKTDDDAYVVMENLRYMLYGYSPDVPIYFGHKLVLLPSKLNYMSGGASYVLSREALRRFMVDSYAPHSFCPEKYAYAEDVCMGYCMQKSGVYLADSRFAVAIDQKPKFFPLDLGDFLLPIFNETMPEWLIAMTPYPIEGGFDCCSNFSIVFHYESPPNMYRYEFLIYHLQTFGLQRGTTTALPAKLTDQQVTSLYAGV